MVLNVAAVTKTKLDHVTPIVASIDWNLIHVRLDFKVLLMTYKIVNGLTSSYLSDLLKLYIPSQAPVCPQSSVILSS